MTSAFRESKWPQRIVRVRQLLSTLRRVVVIGAVLGAVYFAIASLLYPDWSFEFVWRKSFLNLNDGWLVGLDEIKAHPYTVSLLLAALFCASLILRRFKTSLLPLADRIWAWLVSGALLTFLITTLLIYASESETHDLLDHAIALDEETIRIVNEQLTPKRPNIRPPIDFLYMNRHSVEALYNEIEPELIEKRRTIASSGKSEAKAGVTGSGVSAEFAATKGKESTASYERVEFATARQCLEVMRFALDEGRAKYYSDLTDWYGGRQVARLQSQSAAAKGPITKEALEKLRVHRTPQDEEREAERELTKELSQLSGLLFVQGNFSPGPALSESAVLTKEFTKKPKRIVFRIILAPSEFNATPVASLASANLTVFGRVIKPLGEDGTIEVRALAIF